MNYFNEALSNFTTQVAYKDSICRLYDKGLSNAEIIKNCSYPVTEAMINSVIAEYLEKKEKPKSEYIVEYNQYGQKSFRKIK